MMEALGVEVLVALVRENPAHYWNLAQWHLLRFLSAFNKKTFASSSILIIAHLLGDFGLFGLL